MYVDLYHYFSIIMSKDTEDGNHRHPQQHQHQHQQSQQSHHHHQHLQQPTNTEFAAAASTVAIDGGDEIDSGMPTYGEHIRTAGPWLTWRVLLAVVSTLFCPIFGVAAFVLAGRPIF